MADLILLRESRVILKQMDVVHKEGKLLCPILKILQMRHSDLDTEQATTIVKRVLND
jgi:hypothetical protein